MKAIIQIYPNIPKKVIDNKTYNKIWKVIIYPNNDTVYRVKEVILFSMARIDW